MEKLFGKVLVSFFTVLSVISASLLWLTAEVKLKSQSAYWDQPNVIWYILMHVSITMTFFILNSMYYSTRKLYGLVSFFSIATLMFNLIENPIVHDSSTAILFVLACYCIIFYGKEELKRIYWILCSIASIFFLSGLFKLLGPSGIFLGEYIAEICLSTCVLLEIWYKKK